METMKAKLDIESGFDEIKETARRVSGAMRTPVIVATKKQLITVTQSMLDKLSGLDWEECDLAGSAMRVAKELVKCQQSQLDVGETEEALTHLRIANQMQHLEALATWLRLRVIKSYLVSLAEHLRTIGKDDSDIQRSKEFLEKAGFWKSCEHGASRNRAFKEEKNLLAFQTPEARDRCWSRFLRDRLLGARATHTTWMCMYNYEDGDYKKYSPTGEREGTRA